MTNTSLAYYLKVLRLPTFLSRYESIAERSVSQNAGYEKFLLDLSEEEVLARQSRAIQIKVRKAKFPSVKMLDSFEFAAIPSLNKQKVIELSKCEYITKHANVIMLGNSGTGKTHIAISLGLAACQQGKSVLFVQATHLTHSLLEAHKEHELLRLQRKLAKIDLLIIDELGFVPFSKAGAELLFDVLSKRYEAGSCIITSNLPFPEWTQIFGCERLTGALLDRLTHHVHILEMNGESYRLTSAKKAKHKTEGASTAKKDK